MLRVFQGNYYVREFYPETVTVLSNSSAKTFWKASQQTSVDIFSILFSYISYGAEKENLLNNHDLF